MDSLLVSETYLVRAWIKKNYRDVLYWERVRLGEADNPDEAAMFSVLQRWADAVIILDDGIVIVEAKLRPEPGAVGQLEFYERMFRLTPRFEKYKDWPVALIFLTTVEDKEIRAFCVDKGIHFEVFTQEDALKTWNPKASAANTARIDFAPDADNSAS